MQDGFVSFKEFILGLLVLGGNSLEVDEDALDLVYRMHDMDRDGNIDINEAEKVGGKNREEIFLELYLLLW